MELLGVENIFRALNDAHVEYVVVGGLAVNAHGYARLTMDVDLVVRLQADNIERAFAALGTLGYRPSVPVTARQFSDPAQREVWQRTRHMRVLNLVSDRFPLTALDVFISEPFDFADEYARSVRLPFAPGVEVPVLRLEALLKMKQLAARPQDAADVDALKRISGL